MFPGIVSVRLAMLAEELSLIDTTSGAVVRRLPNMSWPGWFARNPPQPGTPSARLLLSSDAKLYELPSIAAEPRLLLPIGKP
jgi:hypothetical protein